MSQEKVGQQQTIMSRYLIIVLGATLVINLLSAYIRHIEAGIGCEDWPQCYGLIGQYVQAANESEIARKALAPTQMAKRTHRGIATILVIAVLLLVHHSRRVRMTPGLSRTLPYAMLGVLLLLAVVGPASYLKTLPIIAVVNLVGGLSLLAIAWWLWLQLSVPLVTSRRQSPPWLRSLARSGWVLLLLQIILGIWVSASFSGLACTELTSCSNAGVDFSSASNSSGFFQKLALNDNGHVLFSSSSVTIHLLHRIGAIITGLILFASAVSVLRHFSSQRPLATTASCIIVLLAVQCLLGVTGIVLSLPLLVVLTHNLVATLLMLAVMALNYQLQLPG